MSRRIFVNVGRGMTDKTPACIYPWEVDILALVHGQEITEVTIDEMCSMKGVAKIETQKLKKLSQLKQKYAPNLRGQLELMAYVDPEDDPASDPAAEYNRMAEKYGMDKEFPVPIVERIYGQFSSGAFTAKLKEFADERMPRPAVLDQTDEPGSSLADLSMAELRQQCRDRGVSFKATEGKASLIDKLEAVVA